MYNSIVTPLADARQSIWYDREISSQSTQ